MVAGNDILLSHLHSLFHRAQLRNPIQTEILNWEHFTNHKGQGNVSQNYILIQRLRLQNACEAVPPILGDKLGTSELVLRALIFFRNQRCAPGMCPLWSKGLFRECQ